MSGVTFRLDLTQFQQALRQYMPTCRNTTLPDELNRHGYYIATKASQNTPKVAAETVRTELGATARMSVKNSEGKSERKSVPIYLTKANKRKMSLAEAIIRSKIAKRGGEQPSDSAIQDMIAKMIGSRMKSLAYLSSGWPPAIRQLFAAAFDKPSARGVKGVKQWGTDQGKAIPAKPGWKSKVTIENSANGKSREDGEALIKYGTPPLQKALDDEASSMMVKVVERMKREGRRQGIRMIG